MKPLSNLTVVDLTVNTPGPFCSMVLRDLGAYVVKVEPPGGDPLRHNDEMWAGLNRGKQSIVLDLKTENGRKLLRDLSLTADIILEGWRPGVSERLAADYETLSEKNPGLVYCSISGFGQTGPWKNRPGHDINFLALSGYFSIQADIEGRPWPPAVLVSDMAAGLHAAVATLAAINARHLSGRGTYIDLSMAEASLSMLTPEFSGINLENSGDKQPNVSAIPHYGLFQCADGRWLTLGIVNEDHFWRSFCSLAGLDTLANLGFQDRMDRAGEIRSAINLAIKQKDSGTWENSLSATDIPMAVVEDPKEVIDSPQFKERGAFVDLLGRRYLTHPAHFSEQRMIPTAPPPELDQHRKSILSKLASMETNAAGSN